MKNREKKKAIDLRNQGTSMRDIALQLGVSKASVSLWTRDIVLSKEKIHKLKNDQYSFEATQKRRLSRLKNEDLKRSIVIHEASKNVPVLHKKDLFLIGVSLYWAEGGKTVRGLVRFSNSDVSMIKVMMRFFREVCTVPEEKFRIHIHTHEGLNIPIIEDYWSEVTSVSKNHFFKTYVKQSISSKNKRHTLPYGTCDVYICDTQFHLRMKGWLKGLYTATMNI